METIIEFILKKETINTDKGILGVCDLFDLNNDELKKIYKRLQEEVKDVDELSIFDEENKVDEEVEKKKKFLEIIEMIVKKRKELKDKKEMEEIENLLDTSTVIVEINKLINNYKKGKISKDNLTKKLLKLVKEGKVDIDTIRQMLNGLITL